MIDEDQQFFTQYPERLSHIRVPRKIVHVEKRTHQTWVADECEDQFAQLGPHRKDRRRILLWCDMHGKPRRILKIPFLLFADETVEDDDTVLLPIIHQIMDDARRRYGV